MSNPTTSYYRLVKKIPHSTRKVGDIFRSDMQFPFALSEKLLWQTVFKISEADIIKYRNYLELI